MVQCELDKMELIDLDMGLMRMLIEAKQAQREQMDNEKLAETIKRLEALHHKVFDLIEIA